MKTVNLRLVGGLGNQLFQFSAAMILANDYTDSCINIDASAMVNYKENWGVLLFDVLDKDKLSSRLVFDESVILKLRVARLFGKSRLAYKAGLISDKNFYSHLEGITPNTSTVFLDGYFQNRCFLKSYVNCLEPYLRKDLKISLKNNVVVINVRGGEFVNLGWSGEQDRCIYEKFVKQVYKEVADPQFHVVTDDLEYAHNLLFGVCEVFKYHNPNPFSNFRWIYSSKYKIISRSTFAKWAAFLSNDFSKSFFLD